MVAPGWVFTCITLLLAISVQSATFQIQDVADVSISAATPGFSAGDDIVVLRASCVSITAITVGQLTVQQVAASSGGCSKPGVTLVTVTVKGTLTVQASNFTRASSGLWIENSTLLGPVVLDQNRFASGAALAVIDTSLPWFTLAGISTLASPSATVTSLEPRLTSREWCCKPLSLGLVPVRSRSCRRMFRNPLCALVAPQ
jgi:hypothetical protein